MTTQIFESYSDFLRREDKNINGVDKDFANAYPNYEEQNETNNGCWNCSRCSGCSDCSDCSDCSGLKYKSVIKGGKQEFNINTIMGNYPKIDNIHQKVFEAASRPNGLNMNDWHTCETTHCRAGWVVHLAGETGRNLEQHTSTLFAAMMIYETSSNIKVSPVRFFRNPANRMLLGCNCSREDIIQLFKKHDGQIEVAGNMARTMKHGIVIHDNGPLFIECDIDKLNIIDPP